jgi:hypothetical protein
LRGPVLAGVSAHEIAADVVAPMNAAGVSSVRASVAIADASPRAAASSCFASSGQPSGVRSGLSWETSRSP